MTHADLARALAEAHSASEMGGEGLTVLELTAALHLSPERVRNILRPMLATGKVRLGRKVVLTMHGHRAPVASYVLATP